MITVVYLPNPFKPSSRILKPFTPDEVKTLSDLKEHFKIHNPADFIWAINGHHIEDSKLDTAELRAADYVAIVPKIRGGGGGGKNVLGVVAALALVAFTGGAGGGLLGGFLGSQGGMLGLGLALYLGGSLLMGNQKTPTIDAPKYDGAFEGGHGWSVDNIRNKPGSPLPVTFGSIRTSGQLLQRRLVGGMHAGKWTQFLELLLAAGEGPLDSITDIKVNDIPIGSISGASYEVKLGTNNQTAVSLGVSQIAEQLTFSSELPMSTTEWVTKAMSTPGTRITLEFVAPAGIYAVVMQTGANVEVSMWIRGQYREVGASTWLDMWPSYPNGERPLGSFNARKPLYFKEDFTPPNPTKLYEFRVQNYTFKWYDDNHWHGAYSEMPGNMQTTLNWLSLTSRTNRALTFPGTAIVALSLPATENLSGGMPKVSWTQTRANIYAWNPTAEAYQQKPATNLAWMIYDIIHACRLQYNIQTSANQHVVYGEPAANIDYDTFNEWATYCGTEVEGVARCVGNLLLDSAEQMWPAIQKIATSARGFIIQQAGVFKPVWDAPKTVSQIFTSGNIINGSVKGGFLSEKERATAIEASFLNEDNGFERDTLFVPSDDYNPMSLDNPTQIYFPGLTSSDVVYRACKHILRRNKYLRRTISFQADIDSIVAEIGDVVGVQSDITDWGVGGRIMGATTTKVVIDQAVSLSPEGSYTLLVRAGDGTLTRKAVDAVAEAVTTTELNFTGDPWSSAPVRFELYAFGVTELETKPFTITGISRNSDLQATIEGIEYVAGVYSDDTDFPVIDYTAANAAINTLTVNTDTDTGRLLLSWSVPEDRDYGGAWVYIDGKPYGFIVADQHDITIDMPPGTYGVTVLPIDGNGRGGTAVEQEVTLGQLTVEAVSNIILTSAVRQQADGTALVFIGGTFDIPTLATSVLVEIGEGAEPESWTTIQDCRVPALSYGPVKPGTIYALRFTAKNRYAVAETVEDGLTTTGDTTPPGQPSISATSYLKNVSAIIALGTVPSDLAGFQIFRHTANNSALASLITSVSSKDGRAEYHEVYQGDYGDTLYYWAKAFDTWGNVGAFSSAAGPLTIAAIEGADIVDAALSRSALFAAGVVDAAAIASQAVTNAKLANDAVNTAQIVAGAITELKLANDAVTAAKLNVAAIDGVSGNIVSGAVGELQLAANAVTAAKIKAGEVGSNALAAGAVTELKLASAAVTEAKIAANAVNTNQINNAALSMPAGPVAAWTAKGATTASIAEVGGVRDISGNGNHGQAFGGIAIEDSVVGKAFVLDGVDDYAAMPCASPASGAISLCAWVYQTRDSVIERVLIGANGIYTGLTPDSFGYFRFLIFDGYSRIIKTTATINGWAHYVGTFVSGTAKLYKDGVLAAELTGIGSLSAWTSMLVGKDNVTGYPFAGKVAGIRIYDRALTAAEVKTLYMMTEDATFGTITADLLTTGELITKTAQIKDAIISSAKISDLSADKINAGTLAAARIAAGSLAANKITGTALVVGGAAGDVNSGTTTISGGKITASSVTASQLAANSVTADKIQAGAVTAAKVTSGELITLTAQIKDAVVTSAKIAALDAGKITTGSLAADRIAAGSLAANKIAGTALVVTGAAADVNAGSTTISGGKITAASVTALQLAADSVTADKIYAGAVTTAKLAAGAVTAEKMLIANPGAALNSDPSCSDASAFTGGSIVTLADGVVGTTALRATSGEHIFDSKWYPLDRSKSYRLRLWARSNGTAPGKMYFRLYYGSNFIDAITASTLTSTWVEKAGIVAGSAFPAGTTQFRIGIVFNHNSAVGYHEIQDLRLEEVLPATLIQDGAIVTDKLAANAVTAAKINAGAVETAKLAAGAVETAKLAANAVTAEKISAGAITAEKINVAAVDMPKGEAIRISAKTGTTNSIALANGVKDVSGYGNHLTAYNGVTMAPTSKGRVFVFGNALNRYLGGGGDGQANSPTAISIYCRFYLAGATTGGDGYQNIVNRSSALSMGSSLYNITYNNVDKLMGGFNGGYTTELKAMTSGWVDAVISWDGATVRYYIDAVMVASAALAAITVDTTNNYLRLGGLNSANRGANCYIADFRTYNRALTLAEIQTLYMLGGDNESGTITADRVVTGQIKSLNYSTTAGSMIDLDAGDVKMGGSSAPRFSFTNSTNTGVFAGFTFNATDLTAGTGSTAIGISTDAKKRAFWAGGTTPSAAKFNVSHSGNLYCVAGQISAFAVTSTSIQSLVNIVGGSESVTIYGAEETYPGFQVNHTDESYDTNVTIIPSSGSSISNAPVSSTVDDVAYYGFYTSGKGYAHGGWVSTSDETVKSDIQDVSVLKSLKNIPVKKYRLDNNKLKAKNREREFEKSLREKNNVCFSDADVSVEEINEYNPVFNIGAMAKEFNSAFGVNRNSVDSVCLNDQIGVALRAIQELAEIVDEQAAEIAELRAALKLPEKQKKQVSAEFTAEEIEKAADKHVKAAYDNIMQELKQ